MHLRTGRRSTECAQQRCFQPQNGPPGVCSQNLHPFGDVYDVSGRRVRDALAEVALPLLGDCSESGAWALQGQVVFVLKNPLRRLPIRSHVRRSPRETIPGIASKVFSPEVSTAFQRRLLSTIISYFRSFSSEKAPPARVASSWIPKGRVW